MIYNRILLTFLLSCTATLLSMKPTASSSANPVTDKPNSAHAPQNTTIAGRIFNFLRTSEFKDRAPYTVLSADGNRLASFDYNGRYGILHIFDTGTKKCLYTSHYANRANRMAWNPDNTHLAATIGNTIYIINAQTSTHTSIARRSCAHILAWSPDGNRLASASHEDYLTFFDRDGTKLQNSILGRSVSAIAFLPDGKRLAYASTAAPFHDKDPEVHLLGYVDLETNERHRFLNEKFPYVKSLHIKPDGTLEGEYCSLDVQFDESGYHGSTAIKAFQISRGSFECTMGTDSLTVLKRTDLGTSIITKSAIITRPAESK